MTDRINFTKFKMGFVPERPGIYFIWKGDSNACYYVGKADTSIKERLSAHLRSPSRALKPYLENQDAKFSYIVMENTDMKAIKKRESEFIKKLNPHGNIKESKRRNK